MSCAHKAQTSTRYTTDSMHRFHRSNAAAHTPCVCDTPMCAVLLWLVVFVVVFHRPPDFSSYVCTQAVMSLYICCAAAQSTDHRPDNNSDSSAQSLLTSSFLHDHNHAALPSSSSSGHTLHVSMIVLRILLCVIQHCHCSSGAQHSVPTAAAGRVLCACGKSALYAQYYCSVRCCCRRHWPMHAYLPQCVRHFLLGTDHPRCVSSTRATVQLYNKNKSSVQGSCTAAFAQNILTVATVWRVSCTAYR